MKLKLKSLKTKSNVGRPTDYSEDLANKICAEMANGSSLRSICRQEDMPVLSSVFRWIRDNLEFREQYELAMEQRVFALGEELLDIADDSINEVNNADPKASGAVAQSMKLRVDTRKWIMSKMQPKKYGDTFDMTTKGDKLTSGNTIVFKDFSKKEERNS